RPAFELVGGVGACRAGLDEQDALGHWGCSLGSGTQVDLPVLHDEAHVLGGGDVGGGVAGDGDDVGEVAGCDLAEVVAAVDELGAGDGGGLQRLHGGHPAVDHGPELLGVVAVGDGGGVGAAGDLHSGGDGLAEHGPGPGEDLGGLGLGLGRGAGDVEALGEVAGRDEERA